MPRVPFAFQSYRDRSLPIAAQRLINFFAEQAPADAKAQIVLRPTGGLFVFTVLPTAPVRGMHVMGEYLYVVSGLSLYRVDISAVVTPIGSIAGTAPVTMADNGIQLVIVAPDVRRGWVMTGTTLTQITDPDFQEPISVTVIDGFAVFGKADSTEFFISDADDALSFDALNFAAAERSPDNIVGVRRVGGELWIFGEKTVEIFSTTVDENFPFLRIAGGLAERGCVARDSITTGAGTVAWLGEDRAFYIGDNLRPARISTHAIEQALAGYSVVSDARGWFYEQEGHQFFAWSFANDGATWVFDLATRVWHERESEGYKTWRCVTGAAFAGGVIGGDSANGTLYRVDSVLYDDAGTEIRRTATGTHFHAEGRKMFFRRLDLDMETGTGLPFGQGADPQMWLQFSDDGGRTWSDERWTGIGAQGQYRRRARWSRLGAARDRVFRIGMSDPVRTAIVAANLDISAGQT